MLGLASVCVAGPRAQRTSQSLPPPGLFTNAPSAVGKSKAVIVVDCSSIDAESNLMMTKGGPFHAFPEWDKAKKIILPYRYTKLNFDSSILINLIKIGILHCN